MSKVQDALNAVAALGLTMEEVVELQERLEFEVEVAPSGTWVIESGKTPTITHRTPAGGEDPTLTVSLWHGAQDGKPVVQIDGAGDLRVNINDAPIWDRVIG